MFSNNKKSKILFTTLVISIIILISSAVFWQSFIINQINDRLSINRFEVTSAKISGNLFSSINIYDVTVIHPSYGNMSIKRGSINIDFFSSFISKFLGKNGIGTKNYSKFGIRMRFFVVYNPHTTS